MEMNSKDLSKYLDEQTVLLVAHLCKRIEVIEKICKESKNPSELINEYPNLFKNLSKELIYEHNRKIKKYLFSSIPAVVYRKA